MRLHTSMATARENNSLAYRHQPYRSLTSSISALENEPVSAALWAKVSGIDRPSHGYLRIWMRVSMQPNRSSGSNSDKI